MINLDLSSYYPGCGLKVTEKVGGSTVTLIFNDNKEEAEEALNKSGKILISSMQAEQSKAV